MPAWWKGKSKSKPSPRTVAGPRKEVAEEEEDRAVSPGRAAKKEKANSFDGALLAGKSRDLSPVAGEFAFGHPLPRPSVSLPTPDHGAASTCASSLSSSASSSDDNPDHEFYRYSEPINMPRGRNPMPDSRRQHHAVEDRRSPVLDQLRLPEISISPRKEFQLFVSDASSNGAAYGNTCMEAMFNPRMASPTRSPRGHPLPTSPVKQRALGVCPGSPTRRQDDMRNSPHPLPLPPGSPSSSSLRSFQSQWKKGKLLGRGTFGHVYLGFNSDSGQMCAIKEVKVISDDTNSKESLRQLNQAISESCFGLSNNISIPVSKSIGLFCHREIDLLRKLSHPNIVQYYGSELDEDTLSVYLEYVSGGSIHKLLQEYGPFKEPVIRSYAAQILSGLAYLHGRNTVHRDIKGANILVDPTGEIKLADFGMAKHISSYTSIRSFKGSPYWMAPEVIMNTSGYSLAVDIWSLGCTVLEMATSKPPWSQFEGVAAIFKIGNSKDIPEIPDHISPDGKSFLKLCLQRDPSARPTAAQLMDHPFVRDQATIKSAKSNMIRDVLLSSSDVSHTTISAEFSSNRSVSPLRDRDYGMRHTVGFPTAFKNPSDMASMRMNMSLPVSPCSSPLHQSRQPNRSCLPSPPHPAFSAGAINYSPSNYTLYPMRPNSNFRDPWPEIAQLRVPSPYDSTRR